MPCVTEHKYYNVFYQQLTAAVSFQMGQLTNNNKNASNTFYLCCFTQYAISFLNILSLMHFCCLIQFSFSSPISILFHQVQLCKLLPTTFCTDNTNCGCQNFHSQTFCDFGKMSTTFFAEFVCKGEGGGEVTPPNPQTFLLLNLHNFPKGVLHPCLRYESHFRSLQKHVFNISWNKKCDFNWGEILPQIDIRVYRV